MKNVYICEMCGKSFDAADECEEHENKHIEGLSVTVSLNSRLCINANISQESVQKYMVNRLTNMILNNYSKLPADDIAFVKAFIRTFSHEQ